VDLSLYQDQHTSFEKELINISLHSDEKLQEAKVEYQKEEEKHEEKL